MQYFFPDVKENSLLGRAYQILDPLSGGKVSDDNPVSLRLMMRNVITTYGFVLREYMKETQDRGEVVSPQMFFTYQCKQLEPISNCDACKNTGVVVKRFKIPKLALFAGSVLIKSVGTAQLSFTQTSSLREAVSMSKEMAYNPGRPAYWVDGGYGYVSLPGRYGMICAIEYSIVPEDPSSGTELCFDVWNDEFPMADHLWAQVSGRIKSGEGNILLNTIPAMDVVNNGRAGNNTN